MNHHPIHPHGSGRHRTDPRDPAGDTPAYPTDETLVHLAGDAPAHPGGAARHTAAGALGPGWTASAAALEGTRPQEAATTPVRSRHGARGRHGAVPRRRAARQLLVAVRAVVHAIVDAARTLRRALTGATRPAPGGHLAALVVAPGMLAVNDLPTVIDNLTTWVVGILAGAATLFLTIGGARYLMAGGDPGEVERAKGALKSAALGYALAMLAPVIMNILRQILGV